MYRTVVLATDGSAGADVAADHAIALAAGETATLHVLHAVDVSAVPLDDHSAALLTALEETGREAVETVARRARDAGVTDVVEAVERGPAHRRIVDYAGDHDADLVVVGTRGRTGLSRMLLGSVAERVVRTADRPVLVVPAGPEPEDEGDTE
jgi:nucleotide-binding universal stress UspA family protein